MNIIQEIGFHEMQKQWAIGEVKSQFFYSKDPAIQEETLLLLKSGDPSKEAEGIKRHQKKRGCFVGSIPADTKWFLASLDIAEDEFGGLRTIRDPGWEKYSRGSYLLCDAANYLIKNP